MKKRPEIFFGHMIDAAEQIEKYIKGMKQQEFLDDDKTIDAVIRQFEILGEAAGNVRTELTQDSPIAWKSIVGLRNKLIHDYLGVDAEIVWETAKQELPKLKKYLKGKI